jgi:hypothetical protein
MLPLASRMTPMLIGRAAVGVRCWIVWGCPSSSRMKSSMVKIRYQPALTVDDGRDHVDQPDVDLQLSAKECAQEQEDGRRVDNSSHG